MPATPPKDITSTDAVAVVDPTEWDARLAAGGGDDLYFRRGYLAASSHLETDVAGAVLLSVAAADGEFLLPLLLRTLPGGDGYDATSPYGYGGPVVQGDVDLPAVGAAIDAWSRHNRVVTTFLRLHPLTGNAAWCPPSARVIPLGATVAWRLDGDGDLHAGMHSHHRRAVNRAQRAGVTTLVREGPHDLGAFRAMYEHTMRRQQASPYYFFPTPYWDALSDGAGGTLVVVEAHHDGAPVAMLVCMRDAHTLHYHLGATADAARALNASNACFLAAAQWGRDQGLTRMHLGGGVGADTTSSLFVFKHRYDPGSTPHPFHVATWVHDPDAYRRLTGGDDTTGFFPPWRA